MSRTVLDIFRVSSLMGVERTRRRRERRDVFVASGHSLDRDEPQQDSEPHRSPARSPSMRQILFIQGGGADVHDAWDDKLVASLKRELGEGYDVRYPRMPDEDDPKFAKWKPAIGREIAGLDEGAVLIGHSIGGTMLVHALAEQLSE